MSSVSKPGQLGRDRVPLNAQSFGVLFVVALTGTTVGLLSAALRLSADRLAAVFASLGETMAVRGSLGWLLPAVLGAIAVVIAVGLARRFAPEAAGSGVQEIEGALAGVRPVHWRRLLPTKFVGAVFSLGSGMALGREGPTVQMGGYVGAMLGDSVRLPSDTRHVLIASGAAAGLAAAFNAPLAGVIFVIEEMRPQFKFGFLSFQSVLLAAVCSDIVTRAVFGDGPLIETPPLPSQTVTALWALALYGAVIGAAGFVFNKALVGGLDLVERLGPRGRLGFAATIGAIVGIAGTLHPPVVGGGYHIIHAVFETHWAAMGLLLLFVVRFALTVGSYATGAPGGIFAPMLALGVLLGLLFGAVMDAIAPGVVAHPGVFAVCGMGAFFAATVRAPITGIALAVEMTGDLAQVLPLLVTCLAATITAELLGGRPIYEVLLERTMRLEAKT